MMDPFNDLDLAATALVVIVVALVAGGVLARVLRHQGLRAVARGQGWRWVGQSSAFGRLVASAFPELVDEARRSARRGAMRTARSGSSGRTGTATRAIAGMALEMSGAGARVQARARGRCVAVAPLSMGEATVGEARISARGSMRRMGRHGGGRHHTSTSTCAAAATRLDGQLPPVRLARRRALVGRLLNGVDDTLPDDLTKRFEVVELSGQARSMLVDSGAYRVLLDAGVKIEALTIADGQLAVMTRRRLSRSRAQELVRAVDRLVSALPGEALQELDSRLSRAPVSE
jgi:hypothetical protein